MDEDNLFDRVIYDEGDLVIRKFKGDETLVETICKSIVVSNLDGFKYNVIFFESNPKDFHIAYEYEPHDKAVRKEYYAVYDANPIGTKPKKKKVEKPKKEHIKLNLKK